MIPHFHSVLFLLTALGTTSVLRAEEGPFIGVYENGILNKTGPAIPATADYAAWIGRSVVWGHDTIPFGGGSSWNHISGEYAMNWFLKPWGKWVRDVSGRRFVLSAPMLPGHSNRSGPTKGDNLGPVSLALGAAGDYNVYWKALAERMVEVGLGGSVVRLGWEFNGNWYAWKVLNANDAKNFAAYWRQIVTTMRAVPGTEKMQFDWNGANAVRTSYPLEMAWPGDDVVDFVGIDIYDVSYAEGSYPILPEMPPAQTSARREVAWTKWINLSSNNGIPAWVAIARAHGKPLSVPEWGVMERKDGHGGLDNPVFIRRVGAFIKDPANHVAYASYWDCDAMPQSDNCKISPTRNTEGVPYVTKFPLSAKAFSELFGTAMR